MRGVSAAIRSTIHSAGIVAAIILLAPTQTSAGDAGNGRKLAERWCQSCHAIGGNQALAVTEAPPFASIAGKPGFEEARIATFLLDPHPKMPDLGLSREAAADLAAYIASQK